MADPAKTAKKSTALPPRIVPKTSRYPMAENQAQSTRKSLVRPSTMKQATMTITATAMPLLGISTSLVCSSSSFPSDHRDGFFVATIPDRKEAFRYRLRVSSGGAQNEFYDVYS